MIITFDTLTMRSTHFTLTNYHCSVLHKITTIQSLVLLAILLLSVGVEAQRQSVSSSSSVSDNGNSGASEGNSNFSPSTAIIVIVIVLCFSILGGLSLYIQHCFGMPSSTLSPGRMNNNSTNGLGQSVIDVLPVFEYSAVKELKSGKGELECAVCLCEFQEDETLRLLPQCNHVFHSQCIDAWLVGHTTCPVCRANLVPDPDKVFDKTAVSLQSPSTESNCEVRITIPEHEQTKSVPRNIEGLPRSHSTGHSITPSGENCERFTLRLPAEVRRQLLARTKLKRATSLVDLPSQPNSRRGYHASGIDEDITSSKYGLFFKRSIMSRVGSFGSTAKVVE